MQQIRNQPGDAIIRQILDELYGLKKSPILLGVDGGQGSGKSTFLRRFKKIVDEDGKYTSISLETDNFLVERSQRENLQMNYFKDLNNINRLWDFQRLSELLSSFMSTFDSTIHVKNLYEHVTGKRDKEEIFTFRKNNMILVGGPYLLNPTFPNFDFKVFLKVSKDNRFSNNIAEGMARGKSFESRKKSFEKFENFFESYFSAKLDMYDMIIDNNDFNNPFIEGGSIASFKQFKIYRLTKKLVNKYSNDIILSLDQIPLVGKHTKEQLMSDFNGKRKLYGKWNSSIIAIDSNGIFAGVIIGSERKKEDNLWYPQNCFYINDFAVNKKFQKLGLGRFLIKSWVDYNKSMGFTELHGKLRFAVQTNSDKWNKHVHRIYESAGFKKFATKPYDNRVDNVYLLEK